MLLRHINIFLLEIIRIFHQTGTPFRNDDITISKWSTALGQYSNWGNKFICLRWEELELSNSDGFLHRDSTVYLLLRLKPASKRVAWLKFCTKACQILLRGPGPLLLYVVGSSHNLRGKIPFLAIYSQIFGYFSCKFRIASFRWLLLHSYLEHVYRIICCIPNVPEQNPMWSVSLWHCETIRFIFMTLLDSDWVEFWKIPFCNSLILSTTCD